jgi:hypothetical protein
MDHLHYYLILDGAKMSPYLETAKLMTPSHRSLYLTEDNDPLQLVAPYLFTFHHGSPFAQWFESNGKGESWGTIFSSYKSFDHVFKHFRQNLFITTENNEKLYFRFYDPRVLRTFLPICTKQQLLKFFGPIHDITCEDLDEEYHLKFFLRNHELHKERRHTHHKIKQQHPSRDQTKSASESLPANKKNPWID